MTEPLAPPALRARLFDALLAPEPDGSAATCWAILDGARDPRIVPALRRTLAEQGCLYAGALDPALEAAAPHLARVERGNRAELALLDEGFGQSWGVFFRSGASFEVLRRHLRRFLRTRLWDGRTMLFRYYDPRVLRVYLPSCTAAEADTLFGPIRCFALEDAAGEALVELRRADDGADGVATRVVPLGPRRRKLPELPGLKGGGKLPFAGLDFHGLLKRTPR